VPWVRFDDQFPIHRKVDGLSDAAYRLHTSAVFWSARNLTDGCVTEDDLGGVTARVRTPARFAAECVNQDVWHEADYPCPSENCPAPRDFDGWVIHDYWQYQPTKEQVLKDREAAAARQKKWRERRSGRSNAVTNAVNTSSPPRPVRDSGAGKPPAPWAANGRADPPGPAARARKPKPTWCGMCDRDTRLTGPADAPYRCPNCHPLIERY
jgi:hypothetical protein